VSVELKVTLVGEDPQQQAAFTNPQPAPASGAQSQPAQPSTSSTSQPASPLTSATSTTPPSATSPLQSPTEPATTERQTVPPESLVVAELVGDNTAKADAPPASAQPTEASSPALFPDSIEELIDAIDDLVSATKDESNSRRDVLDEQGRSARHGSRKAFATALDEVLPNEEKAKKTKEQTDAPAKSLFDNLSGLIDQKIDDFGLKGSRAGNLVSNLSHTGAGLANRATQFASGLFGAGQAASGAAAGAGASAGAATGVAASGAGTAAAGAGAAAATGAMAAAGPLVAVALAAGAAALSVKKFMETMDAVAKNLEDLSPAIASVQAQFSANQELMRLDRAKRIGDEVASLQASQNRLSESMYEIQTKIYELLLKTAPLIEVGINSLTVIMNTLDVLIATVNRIYASITLDPTDNQPAAKALTKSMADLADAMLLMSGQDTNPKNEQIDPFLAELLAADNKLKPPIPPRRGKGLGGLP